MKALHFIGLRMKLYTYVILPYKNGKEKMSRYYYGNNICGFVQEEPKSIFGTLTENHRFSLETTEKTAWIEQIKILQNSLSFLDEGYILFEYSIPRMGKRVDSILLTHGIVFVIEFKVGEKQHTSQAIDQVLDYAIDLKNFHQQSHHRPIVPILIATEAPSQKNSFESYEDKVFRPLKTNATNFQQLVKDFICSFTFPHFDPFEWMESGYKPTPTIIEAAQALYRGHNVAEISRSDASAINLSRTSNAIYKIIEQAKEKQQKAICFITGVPGAGKTLAGLNIANERLQSNGNEHAVFLSGNGPLVKVLREALARNDVAAQTARNIEVTKSAALTKAQAFIQNIHHFRDEALEDEHPPLEKVVIFDEAQRAWDQDQTASFMKRKRNIPDFSMSEPQFLISVMDRHPDWAVIVCLVGGGQEIHTGEAGLQEWFSAINKKFPHWHVYASSKINENEYSWESNLFKFITPNQLHLDDDLHLGVSIRSYRSEKVAAFIKAILNNEPNTAQALFASINQSFPIALTRDLNKAKLWIKSRARGTERFGLLASSGGYRLRPLGIQVQAEVDVVLWFLNEKNDVRSSYYLEEVATEFDVQGLELDWTCIVWDADLRYQNGKWEYKAFQGTKWQNVNNQKRQIYLENAYRVLLTRARQGMVIVVPKGDEEDETRKPSFYDETYEYLRQMGLNEI